MSDRIDEYIKEINSFIATDNEGENLAELYEIIEKASDIENRQAAIPHIFSLLERNLHADLGTPGPLVHELESMDGYETFLQESLHRQPVTLTVWMVNRILNSNLSYDDRKLWLQELRKVCDHPKGWNTLNEIARDYLVLQENK